MGENIVKPGILVAGVFLTVVGTGVPAQAENLEHRQQLLKTNRCSGCDLSQASLSGLNLSGADLRGANLSRANLAGADLRYADLSGANLDRADLSGANLAETNLTQTSFRQSQLTNTILTGAKGWDETASSQTVSASSSPELLAQEPPVLTEPDAEAADTTQTSPLERSPVRLFGFETANTLEQGELMLQTGGTSFNNPNDFRAVTVGDDNRSNDAFVRADYGITDRLQFTLGLAGKDDTRFSDLIDDSTSLQFTYGIIPAQLKWQFYQEERLQAAAVVGAEIAAPFGPLFFQADREITFTTSSSSLDPGRDEFIATDDSIYLSLALPVSYQVNPRFNLHLNPQVSFFPGRIPARRSLGELGPLLDADVGFDGDSLDYYGTVFGVGLGASYRLTPHIQLAADVTPILTGRNMAGSGGDDSLFVTRPVWNAGVSFVPNSRLGINLYATNRFGPVSSSASNLLAQPGGDWGVGLDFTYLPDVTGSYAIEKRETYPEPSAFLSPLQGFPATLLPIDSILYQLALGSNLRLNPTVRIGLLDDFELAVNFSYADATEELPIEGSIFGRLALLRDDNRAFSAAITAGLIRGEATNRSLDLNTFFLYADLPVMYRLPGLGLSFNATPKVVIPAQFQGLDNLLGISLGTTWNLARNTQLLAQVTPILLGNNQLEDAGVARQIALEGKTPLYSVGIRQLFPTGNSLYAVELFVSNAVGNYGLQGLMALPDGDVQVGARFSILNGVP